MQGYAQGGHSEISLRVIQMSERKKVVITGASSGIGAAAARRFATDGYDVCLNARRESLLNEIHESLAPGKHLIAPGDYSHPDSILRLANQVSTAWDAFDVLVNNAGVFLKSDPIENCSRN